MKSAHLPAAGLRQDYIEEAKMLKVPVKSFLPNKKMAQPGQFSLHELLCSYSLSRRVKPPWLCKLRIKKLKNGMKIQRPPEKPYNFPAKPQTAQRIFCSEKRPVPGKCRAELTVNKL